MMEEITKRVGSSYLGLGVGQMPVISSAICSCMIYGLGVLLDYESKIMSLACLVIFLIIIFFIFSFGTFSEFFENREFKIDRRRVVESEVAKIDDEKDENFDLEL